MFGRQSPPLSYKAHIRVFRQLQLPHSPGGEEVEGLAEMRNLRQSVRPGKWKCSRRRRLGVALEDQPEDQDQMERYRKVAQRGS